MVTGWSVAREVLAIGGVRLALQRIGIDHWRPDARLRSWGIAPLHPIDSTAVAAPCWPEEALWLGAWGEEPDVLAVVSLRTADASTPAARMEVPAGSAITALPDAGGSAHPIAWMGSEAEELAFTLSVEYAGATTSLDLILLRPDAWEQHSGRPAPPPRLQPPPLPPRLG